MTKGNGSAGKTRGKAMEWNITEVKVIGDFALRVRFQDGLEGAVKFLPSFFRGVFTNLAITSILCPSQRAATGNH